jgi:hypothetical protein
MIFSISNLTVDVIPQAIVKRAVREIVGKRAVVIEDSDDLDVFEGASFKLEDGLQIAVRQYAGFPKDTSTIYIDKHVRDVAVIGILIRKILNEFDLTDDALSWERADDPEL